MHRSARCLSSAHAITFLLYTVGALSADPIAATTPSAPPLPLAPPPRAPLTWGEVVSNPPAYTNASVAQLAQKYALAAASTVLGKINRTYRCVDFAFNGTCEASVGGQLNCSSGVEHGFSYITNATLWQIMQALPENTTMEIPNPQTQLGGANPWLLRYIQSRGGVNISYHYIKLPEALAKNGDRSIIVEALLSQYNFDCVMSSYFLLYERSMSVNFLLPHQPFSFVGVSEGQVQVYPSVAEKMWSWTHPFSKNVWLVSTVSTFCALLVQFMCERRKNNRDFLSRHAHKARRIFDQIWSGQYVGFAHVYGSSFFNPVSVLGRFNNFAWAFVVELVSAAYLANLMANITKPPPPVRMVTDVEDLNALGQRACVLNRTSHIKFMEKRFPDVQLQVIDPPSMGAMFDALLKHQCGAAVGPNTGFLNAMAIADPAGKLCSLDFTGFPLESGFYALPWRKSISGTEIDAMSTLVSAAIVSGLYQKEVFNVQFSNFRPPCLARAALRAAATVTAAPVPITLTSLGGVFIVTAAGMLLAAMIQVWKMHKLKIARSRWGKYFWFRSEQRAPLDTEDQSDPTVAPTRQPPHAVLRSMVETMLKTQEDLNKLAAVYGVPQVDLNVGAPADAASTLEELLRAQDSILNPALGPGGFFKGPQADAQAG